MPKRRDKFEGLTAQQKKFIDGLGKIFMTVGDDVRAKRFAEFVQEQQRIHFLMEVALTKLREKDHPTYLRFAAIIRADYQDFFDVINAAQAENPTATHLDANHHFVEPHELVVSGLMTNDGYHMRAALLGWLKDKPSAGDLVLLLEDLQELLKDSQY